MTHRDELGNYLNSLGLTGVGVEVGVKEGRFSRQILTNWQGSKLYLVDVWKHLDSYQDWGDMTNQGHRRYMLEAMESVKPYWDRIAFIQEESRRASTLFKDGTLDFAYIDASHDYESVLVDIATWWPKVKVGGILSGHDYVNADVASDGCLVRFEVKRAVDKSFDKIQQTQEEFPSWWVFK
jgi:hypothetical protein